MTPKQRKAARENWALFQLAGAKGNLSQIHSYYLGPEYLKVKFDIDSVLASIDYISSQIKRIQKQRHLQ